MRIPLPALVAHPFLGISPAPAFAPTVPMPILPGAFLFLADSAGSHNLNRFSFLARSE